VGIVPLDTVYEIDPWALARMGRWAEMMVPSINQGSLG